jgi:predicted alpha/beta-fold hydrolase
MGPIPLSGLFTEVEGAKTVLLVVHGLGGSYGRHYCVRSARAAAMAGVSSLQLALRGADGSGADFYHSALTDDLGAAVRSPELAAYEQVLLLGFSVGGHVALQYAIEGDEPRVRAVAAVCAPLDLARSSRAIDAPRAWLYRKWVLDSLKRMYAAMAARRAVPSPLDIVRRVRTIREWDHYTVVPRFGFGTVDRYYEVASVGSRLERLTVPGLYVSAKADPMVPRWTVADALERASSSLHTLELDPGGHVGFPKRLDVEGRVVDWLLGRIGSPGDPTPSES